MGKSEPYFDESKKCNCNLCEGEISYILLRSTVSNTLPNSRSEILESVNIWANFFYHILRQNRLWIVLLRRKLWHTFFHFILKSVVFTKLSVGREDDNLSFFFIRFLFSDLFFFTQILPLFSTFVSRAYFMYPSRPHIWFKRPKLRGHYQIYY